MPRAVDKLAEAIRDSDKRLERHRRNRALYLGEIAGPRYGTQYGGGPQPAPKLFEAASTLIPHLVGLTRAIAYKVTSDQMQVQPLCDLLAALLGRMAKQLGLAHTLRLCVTDALVGAGIAKVGIAFAPPIDGSDGDAPWTQENGEPFVDPIDLDDYILDPWCRAREAAAFEGNRFRVRRGWAMDCGLYDRAALERIATVYRPGNADRADQMTGAAEQRAAADREDYIELANLWLPDENVVLTVSGEPDRAEVLREAPYIGPPRGPYEMLGFFWLPGNPIPVPIMSVLFDLHVMANKLARKLGRQADRQKDLLLTDAADPHETETLRAASDGEIIGVQDVSKYQPVSFGGGNEKGYEHLAWVVDQFSRTAGNIDLMGGMEAQSETLGQDQILAQQGSVRLADMQDQVRTFADRIGEKLAWYALNAATEAPSPMMQTTSPMGAKINGQLGPDEAGMMRLEDMGLEVDPYSLSRPMSPQEQAKAIVQWLATVYPLVAESAAAQGLVLNAEEVLRVTGKPLEVPVERIFTAIDPAMMAGAGGGMQGPGQVVMGGDKTTVNAGGKTKPEPAEVPA